MKIINATEVLELLPMSTCIDLMAHAMRAASAGDVRVPPRLMMPTIDNSALFALMPGSSKQPKIYGAKIINIHESNAARGLPVIQGFVTLFDHETGVPLALIEGASLTAIRTAATSGMATRYLSRKGSRSHGIYGAGVQATAHIDAINAVRPCDDIVVWSRDFEKAQKFASRQSQRTGLNIVASRRPEDAAKCDIVTTVTAATEPVLMGRWIAPGTHVNLVGAHSPNAREADSDLLVKGSLFTDLLESLFNESGDFLIPASEGHYDRTHVKGEIGNVVAGSISGRIDDEEITIYKSLGVTAQDLFAAHAIYEQAISRNMGTDIQLT